MNTGKHSELANHAWSVADLLRGDYKQSDYGKVILPFTVLRRLECVLAPTRDAVLAKAESLAGKDLDVHKFLTMAAGAVFYNTSDLTLKKIAADPTYASKNLITYIGAFSENAREVLEKYEFAQQIRKLDAAGLLYQVVGKFADLDLRPEVVSNHQMGYVFEELIRRFAEQSNETAGEHFTPREVIELMVNLLIAPDADLLGMPGVVRRVLDPACGTGGMLSSAEAHITALNPQATVDLYGQELNPESWAICRSDLMIKGEDSENIVLGNSLDDNDGHKNTKFDYMLANPPFGVEWKKIKDDVEWEAANLGDAGRYGAGLPRINDGSLLFLQHMISKMKPVNALGEGGSRIGIVFNGSPLFTGAAGSGESEIRRWIIENDWLEAVVALPDQLFYNTGISTYFWILTNRKKLDHQGKVVLLDARDYWVKMRKSMGDKRKQISDEQIREITQLYGEALTVAKDPTHPLHGKVKVFANEDFGYRRITVERPLKLRFELTGEGLDKLAASAPVRKLYGDSDAFRVLLTPLVGSSWQTKADAVSAMRDAVVGVGETWPSGAPFAKVFREAVGTRDAEGEIQLVKGAPEPDPDLRDFENVPLTEDVDEYLNREVLPHVPDAWIDHAKTKVGYEIPFTRHFYVYTPPRPIAEIDSELKDLEAEIQSLLGEVTQ
ncbi:SAM-dependent DNA methyltransferase [Nocardia higoensis]|uniref:site-specific DNA-methyltransferase (adenine-specific) n=1 Tax=Nocardia higoensis TaxID=228599 RepID=A0ABS0D554_9NOCA|nr:class I SAM-dependent DNA methyltransferase [Nocardia higoensis]MBF6353618.1 SAM-dependent DNA methyltransferase [Nocardia higoensis]